MTEMLLGFAVVTGVMIVWWPIACGLVARSLRKDYPEYDEAFGKRGRRGLHR